MPFSANRERRSVAWSIGAALTLSAVWVGCSIGIASAQAKDEPVEVLRETKGPYTVSITMLPERPTVGVIHFTIMPTDSRSSLPIQDALITVVANSTHVTPAYPRGKPEYQVRAINNPDNRSTYVANIAIEFEGLWTFDVDFTSGSSGTASFTFPLDVGALPIDPGPEGAFVLVLILLAFAGGLTYLFLSSKKALRSREEARQAAAGPRA